MRKTALFAMGMIFYWNIAMAGEIYRWVDEKGTIFFSDSPPPYGSFKKQKVEDQIDKTLEKREEIDKRSDISESDKLSEKIKIEIEHQKKTKSIRDYDEMRRELRATTEKYQEKSDQLDNQLRRGPDRSMRADINQEREKIRREYLNEVRRIKEHYGYY